MQAGQEVWRRRRHLSTSLLGVQGTLKQRSERKSVSAGKRNQDVLRYPLLGGSAIKVTADRIFSNFSCPPYVR